MNSQFFSRELEKYEFIQYINIVDDFDMILFISSDIVETFISFIHNHDIQLTLNNALALYSLSIKYEVTNLVDQSQQYISSHHVELIEQFLSTQNPNEIWSYIYEDLLSERLEDYFTDERLFKIPMSTLYRVFNKYCLKHHSQNLEMISFLFNCLTKIGPEAEILFERVKLQNVPIEFLNSKLMEWGSSLNFNFVRSIFLTSTIEINRQLILKDKEKSNEIEKLKERMQNKIDELRV